MRTKLAWILAAALACGGTEAQPDASAPASQQAETPGRLVGEIRDGIRDLPALAASDRVAARRLAVDLYATRQEALERSWGVRGSESPDSTLARTVMEAEAAFHQLLGLLNQEAAPDSAAVASAVAELDGRQVAVLEAAGEAP